MAQEPEVEAPQQDAPSSMDGGLAQRDDTASPPEEISDAGPAEPREPGRLRVLRDGDTAEVIGTLEKRDGQGGDDAVTALQNLVGDQMQAASPDAGTSSGASVSGVSPDGGAGSKAWVRGAPPERVYEQVRTHFAEVRHCHERGLSSRPELEGEIVVKFIIAPDGHVQSAVVSGSTLGFARTETCIVDTVKRWSFEPPDNGIVIVNYPFRLSQSR